MAGRPWTREEVLVAFNIYCRTPFGRLHARNPEMIRVAKSLGRTAGALAMKCCNLASFDPALQERGIKGLRKVAKVDREVWESFRDDPEQTGFKSEFEYSAAVGDVIRIADRVEWQDIEGLDRQALTKVRVNQQLFRSIVLTGYAHKCAICCLPIRQLLIAAHIVPWSIDKKNRMNPQNGICLCALHDRAYDAGIVHVDESYIVRLTDEVAQYRGDVSVQRFLLHYEGTRISLPERWLPEPALLRAHGELIKSR